MDRVYILDDRDTVQQWRDTFFFRNYKSEPYVCSDRKKKREKNGLSNFMWGVMENKLQRGKMN